MNRTFINLMVESYISDNELEKEKSNSAAQNIIEYIEYIKEDDYELYNYIHSLSKTKQKNLIYNILQESEIGSLYSIPSFILFVMAGVFIYREWERGPDYISKTANFFSKIKNTWSVIKIAGKDRWSKTETAMDMIVTNNYHDCINKCQISDRFSNSKTSLVNSLHKLYSSGGFDQLKRGGLKFWQTRETLNESQLNCLINCSLDSLSTLIAKYAGLYINCVKKSNTLYSDTRIYNMLDLGRLPSNLEACKEVRENYATLYDNYIYILKYLFKEGSRDNRSEREYQRWIDILERKISAVSENNYNKLLDVSKQFIGDSDLPNPGVRF
jgi:hypothetical protein